MDRTLIILGGQPVTYSEAGLALAGGLLLVFLLLALSLNRARREQAQEAAAARERQHELDDKMAELGRQNAELSGRLQTMAEVLSSRQVDLARVVTERLDSVGLRVGQGLETSSKATTDNLAKLGERLAVIDAAQARLTGLTQEVVSLKDILANKQSRGAFGQGRMEAIVRDGLPPAAYDFQYTLSNRTRPDCVIRLPGDDRVLAIDAKFPLEAFTALRDATHDEARKQAQARVRGDLGKHVKDVSERYLLPGETQDIAMIFVPSESIYADLIEHFDDVIQRAHRARVVILSPSLMMMAIQVTQSLVRDARMREQAHVIQHEVRNLLLDVGRLKERVGKLDTHFRQAQDDIGAINTTTEKIVRRGDKIDQLEFQQAAKVGLAAE
ncbi:MAG: DNA recombination protein RmuC [Beijerinckiaceae bacterium]|jgi:DNA recombination protein RmuC|nr:DNA recombination protein RmuC [Beijerinckiaceae bacterium]